jgi:hypothetical protein
VAPNAPAFLVEFDAAVLEGAGGATLPEAIERSASATACRSRFQSAGLAPDPEYFCAFAIG